MGTGDAVLLMPSAFAPHVGGVEELTLRLAQELPRHGRPTLVLSNRWPRQLPAYEEIEGVDVLRHPMRLRTPQARTWPRYLLSRLLEPSLVKRLRERRVGLVHVQCVSTQADLARRLAKRLRVPLVVTMQGELTMDATGVYQTRAMRRAWHRLLDAADAISGCSQYVLDEARSQHPRLLSSSVAIANGVHANLAPHGRSSPPYVFAVGRLVPQKGFDVLLRALARTRLPHRLLLAGEGPERPALERLCQELGLSKRVTFLGRQSHDQVLERCASAAAFVLPSRHEPQGIVVLEAMSVGTPVLAAAVGGVPETVQHGVNGFLFPNGDEAALAALIEQVLGAEPDQTTVEGLRVAEAHSWPRVTARYLELYELAGCRLASR